ncbi:rod shape-determining protein MreC [Echinimonas agarilytica]|uniref:Cell shape-determining protein MreC n=1 Tax=Echinimonas agarilytica TaxID=1215918 RepID=A0AA42B6B1_9GAMM|nr:rod shape-determining protein MreC [Echinimonas agarilytica]MCM2678595.1 rod shape-determining protein MreC [Echinimonas agarilytica]
MKPIFGRGPSLQFRLFLAVFAAIILAYLDRNFAYVVQVRGYLSTAVSPVYYVASLPDRMLSSAENYLVSRRVLRLQNLQLKEQAHIHSGQLQLLSQLQRENSRLRALLGSPVQQDTRKVVAEIVAVETDPYRYRVLIDKGSDSGVFVGQPVLDDNGVVGQIDEVGLTTSRVLLIADISHAIPVRVSRNDIRTIAVGVGQLDQLELQHVQHSADIQTGDILVTSGLGGRFPEGYPVARVDTVNADEGLPFSQITAKPIAELDRLRYLLLIWPTDEVDETRELIETLESDASTEAGESG